MRRLIALPLCILMTVAAGAAESRLADEIISIITGKENPKQAPVTPGQKTAPAPSGERTTTERKNDGTAQPPAEKETPATDTKKETAPQPAEKKETAPQQKKEARKKDATPGAGGPEQALMKSGIQFYEAGLYPQAQQKFSEILTQFAQSPYRDSARVWLGKINIRLYQYDAALKELTQVGSDSAEYPPALFTMGDAWQMKGDQLRAIDLFQRLTALFPAHELADDALLRTAKLYLAQHKGQQALEAITRLVKNYGDREIIDAAYYLLAKVYETDPALKDMETARRVYKLFLKKAQSGDSRFARSPLHERIKRDLERLERTYFKMEQ